MVQTVEMSLCFDVQVTPQNITLLKTLARSTAIEEDPDEIEVGDEISIDYVFEGEFSEYALSMAMLFNSSRINKPNLQIKRDLR